MTNQHFLQNYQHLQYGIMYRKLHDLGFASIAWCDKYDSSFFNHAQVESLITEDQLKSIEKELSSLRRKPAIYFEKSPSSINLADFLLQHGYKKMWEDSWMFHPATGIDNDHFDNVKKTRSHKDLEVFLETLDQCYQKDDPQNPYGELGDYLEVAREAWERHSQSGKIEYFTVYHDKKPVAVATLTNFAGIGYISNIGSLKIIRGKGFGKVASLYCVVKSKRNGNQVHALATEEGHYPNEFYKRIGFETKFSALGFVKET